MKANGSRIEILQLKSAPPYTADGLCVSTTDETTADPPARIRRRSAPMHMLFDASAAECAVPKDREHLLAVIEGCGNGFGSFNQWMHALLVHHATASQHGRWIHARLPRANDQVAVTRTAGSATQAMRPADSLVGV